MGDERDTLPGLFAAAAAVVGPERSLLVHDRHQLTYGDIDAQTARVVAVLADAGVQSGDRVAVVAEKSPAVLPIYLATLHMGAIYLPMNPGYTDDEVLYILDDAAPAAVIADPARADGGLDAAFTLDAAGSGTLADAAGLNTPQGGANPSAAAPSSAVKADDPGVLLYTSGTTGRPKGAVLTHGNLASNAATLRDVWGFRPGDRLLHALPIYHAHGLFVGVNVTLATGSSMRWLDRFTPGQVVDAIQDATVFMGVPTYYRRLLADPRVDRQRCAPVRLFVSGSAPLPAALHTEWERRTAHRILERYGMTETGMIASNPLDSRDGERRPGSVGRPLPGVDVRVVDGDTLQPRPAGEVGDIQVRGPNVFAGYWRRPEQTAEATAPGGWFRTGDLGAFDQAGYLTIAGRSKELIITGGLNVYPKEVEDVFDSIPSVVESAVVGLADDDLGERVAAAVVGAPGQPLDLDAIRDDVRRRLAGYKTPKSVTRVDELPRNAMGKVDRARLRRLLLEPPTGPAPAAPAVAPTPPGSQ